MAEERPESREPLESPSGDDYTYDMAHEAGMEPSEHHRRKPAHHAEQGAGEVPPPTPEGDYSYDLAHEVPPAER